MKAYKIDFDGKEFVKVEFDYDTGFMLDYSKDPKTNISDIGERRFVDAEAIDSIISDMNRKMVKEFKATDDRNSFIVKKCKTCGKYFIVEYYEHIWYKSMGWKVPNNCEDCRRRKREDNRKY